MLLEYKQFTLAHYYGVAGWPGPSVCQWTDSCPDPGHSSTPGDHDTPDHGDTDNTDPADSAAPASSCRSVWCRGSWCSRAAEHTHILPDLDLHLAVLVVCLPCKKEKNWKLIQKTILSYFSKSADDRSSNFGTWCWKLFSSSNVGTLFWLLLMKLCESELGRSWNVGIWSLPSNSYPLLASACKVLGFSRTGSLLKAEFLQLFNKIILIHFMFL